MGGGPPSHQEALDMRAAMAHRGPDGYGEYRDEGVLFVHNRLSIIDLSERAAQPMFNEDGTVVLVCSGEIYNFRKLKKELSDKGHRFRSDCDVEVILHCYEDYGERAVSRLKGMFAFAIWDANRKKLVLARDRLGEKPFFYTYFNGRLYFSSELKGLLAVRGMPKSVSGVGVLSNVMFWSTFPPYTSFEGIYSLVPGEYAVLEPEKGSLKTTRYWRPSFKKRNYKSLNEAREAFNEAFRRVIREVSYSDVPIALTLSGGVDSGLIAHFLKEEGIDALAFCAGVGKDDPELLRSEKLARLLGLELTRIIIDQSDKIGEEEYINVLDEPYKNVSGIYLLKTFEQAARLAKVIIMGNGGDELFGGYEGYERIYLFSLLKDRFLPKLDFRNRRLPYLLNRLFGSPLSILNGWFSNTFGKTKTLFNHKNVGFDEALCELFDAYKDYFPEEDVSLYDAFTYVNLATNHYFGTIVLGDLLGMNWSIECRSPFFHPDMLEFAFTLPTKFKFGSFWDANKNKYIGKELINDPQIKRIFYEKKMGMGQHLGFLGDFVRRVKSDSKVMDLFLSGLDGIPLIDKQEVLDRIRALAGGETIKGVLELYAIFILIKWERQYL